MKSKLKQKLIDIAKTKLKNCDCAHDIGHILRVLKLAEIIAIKENADLDIVIPGALFHDIITHQKNTPESRTSQRDSANLAQEILEGIPEYPSYKIDKVRRAIFACSFSNNLSENFLEAQIIQDADKLESTGAIAIMRTFSSAGAMQNLLMNGTDPFCKKRLPQEQIFALDLFFTRLLKIEDKMNLPSAKKAAKIRTDFVKKFLQELKKEVECGDLEP